MPLSRPRSPIIPSERLVTEEPDVQATQRPAARRLAPDLPAAICGGLLVALLLTWSVHNGGYDADTWYWGALASLSLLTVVTLALGRGRLRTSPQLMLAVGALALYVAWSYLSIIWAQSPGNALEGSNKALLYLLLFAVATLLPWTEGAAAAVLTGYVVGVGAIGLVTLGRLATGHTVAELVVQGRLLSPTGYFNSTAALFTTDALMALALWARRSSPWLLRGVLVAIAAADIQLAILAQSRGWLFTLPVVIVLALLVVRERLRVAVGAALAIGAGLIPLHQLLAVYRSEPGGLSHAAATAGRAGLAFCLGLFAVAAVAARGEAAVGFRQLSARSRRRAGILLAAVAITIAAAGFIAATHGRPGTFISRQWNGFIHSAPASRSSSNFGVVGSGRYDFWRVSLKAFGQHPLGGLGQDNFADYYVLHRHTAEEPLWTHSIEMRLLAHTGVIGFLLFASFLAAAISAALRTRRARLGSTRLVAGVGLLPLIVWLTHGSVDWFWEMPALSGPALIFLALAASLGASSEASTAAARRRPLRAARLRQAAAWAAGILTLLAATILLAFPYLSVREVSIATNVTGSNPAAALRALAYAADLNPLSAIPDRLAGTIALQTGDYAVAQQRFDRSISHEPGGWFAWLGAGLAASELGDRVRARHDFEVANSIDSRQPAVPTALARVNTPHPLTPPEAFRLLLVHR